MKQKLLTTVSAVALSTLTAYGAASSSIPEKEDNINIHIEMKDKESILFSFLGRKHNLSCINSSNITYKAPNSCRGFIQGRKNDYFVFVYIESEGGKTSTIEFGSSISPHIILSRKDSNPFLYTAQQKENEYPMLFKKNNFSDISELLYQGDLQFLLDLGNSYIDENEGKIRDSIPGDTTNDKVYFLIKKTMGREDVDIQLVNAHLKSFGEIAGTAAIAVVRDHGVPKHEDVIYFEFAGRTHFYKKLGTFSNDSFKVLSQDNACLTYMGRCPESRDWTITFEKPGYTQRHKWKDTATNSLKAWGLKGSIVGIVDESAFSEWKSSDDICQYQLGEKIDEYSGQLYHIIPSSSGFDVFTFILTGSSYHRVPTNLNSAPYIEDMISDSQNSQKVLAYRTGSSSHLEWSFLDEDFANEISKFTPFVKDILATVGAK